MRVWERPILRVAGHLGVLEVGEVLGVLGVDGSESGWGSGSSDNSGSGRGYGNVRGCGSRWFWESWDSEQHMAPGSSCYCFTSSGPDRPADDSRGELC